MTTRPLRFTLVLVGLTCAGSAAVAGIWHDDQTIEHDGLTRLFRIFEPSLAPPPGGYPLVFIFHGGSNDMYDVMDSRSFTEWTTIADEHGVLLVVPNGAPNGSGNTPWNDCRLAGTEPSATADDVGFIEALIEEAESRYAVDSQRIYATGASNGGQMSYRLALELGWRFAAVAPFVATLPKQSECTGPSQPVSVMIVNGDADPLTAWDGGCAQNDSGCARGEKLSAFETRDRWIAWNAASIDPTQTMDFPDVDPTDGCTVEASYHAGGIEGTEVRLYRVRGGGHYEPTILYAEDPLPPPFLFGYQNRDLESAREVWENFFTQHTLHGSGPNEAPGAANRLTVSRAGAATLELAWDPDCGGGASYAVYRGDLQIGYTSVTAEPGQCNVTGRSVQIPLGEGDADFFLVVPHDGAFEGSYGKGSGGVQRDPASTPCLPQGQPDTCADVGL